MSTSTKRKAQVLSWDSYVDVRAVVAVMKDLFETSSLITKKTILRHIQELNLQPDELLMGDFLDAFAGRSAQELLSMIEVILDECTSDYALLQISSYYMEGPNFPGKVLILEKMY